MEVKVRSLSLLLIITVLVNCLFVPLSSGKSEGLFLKETLSASQNPDQEYPVTVRLKSEISNYTQESTVQLKVIPVPEHVELITFTFLDLSFKDLYLIDNLRPPILSV